MHAYLTIGKRVFLQGFHKRVSASMDPGGRQITHRLRSATLKCLIAVQSK